MQECSWKDVHDNNSYTHRYLFNSTIFTALFIHKYIW